MLQFGEHTNYPSFLETNNAHLQQADSPETVFLVVAFWEGNQLH